MKPLLSERFLDAYNRLDEFMRKTLKEQPTIGHTQLLRQMAGTDPLFRDRLYELSTFARLRNAIVHNPTSADCRPIAEPHEEVVVLYENLVSQVLRPPTAFEIAVNKDRIYFASWEHRVVEVVQTMHRQLFTHVPVLEADRVVGVFSEDTLFCALSAQRRIAVDETSRIADFRAFVPFSAHAGEVFEFIKVDAAIPEVIEMFRRAVKRNQHLGAVFVTERGTSDEPLLGLLTAWDLVGCELLRL